MKRKAEQNVLKDYGSTILVAVIIAFFIRFFIIEAYRIPTSTMRPTLSPGETIFVSKWSFGLRSPLFSKRLTEGRAPRRGEVVLFNHPDEPQRDLIKRVIGIGGDTVQIKAGQVILNGKPLPVKMGKGDNCGTETLPEGKTYGVCWEPPAIEDFGPEKIPAGSLFLLSDLRTGIPASASNSMNKAARSRARGWGVFPAAYLKGKALWVWLSVEPHSFGDASGWFPRFRFERMFRRIE